MVLGRLRPRRRAPGASVPALPRHAAIVGRDSNVAQPAPDTAEADGVESDTAPPPQSVLRQAVRWITARAPAPGDGPTLADDPDPEHLAQPEPIDRPPRTRGLLARFRREKDTENDVDEPFTLPEAGAALASTWTQPADELRPTRDWSSRSPLRSPVDGMSETPPAEPAPTSDGPFRPRPRPVAAQSPPPPPPPPPQAPPPQAASEANEPERPRPRPRPGSERGSDSESGDGGRIGIAGAAAAAAAAPVGLAALRNSPPAGTSDKAADSSTPALSGRADSESGGIGRHHPPDISRFLQATEPQPRDDQKREDNTRARSGNDRGAEDTQKDEETQEGEGTQKAERKPNFLRRHPKAIRRTVRLLLVVAIAIGAAVLLRIYVVQPYYIPSESMEPTLHGCANCNDDRVLVDKLSYRAHDASSNDIVVFHRPAGDPSPENVLIKRVVALPDDTVSLKKGDVYVNGLHVSEPYLNKKCGPHPSKPLTSKSVWKVPSGSVFVLGDNRCNSRDSRAFGPIPVSSVVGKAFAIYWPLNRITKL